MGRSSKKSDDVAVSATTKAAVKSGGAEVKTEIKLNRKKKKKVADIKLGNKNQLAPCSEKQKFKSIEDSSSSKDLENQNGLVPCSQKLNISVAASSRKEVADVKMGNRNPLAPCSEKQKFKSVKDSSSSKDRAMTTQVKVGEAKKRKRKDKEVAIFGNYRHYYGYRVCKDMKADPRLMVLKKGWFEDKDCLDIGCNQGLITIEIAKRFQCRRIHGVDIDASLVESAYWNLRKIAKMEKERQRDPEHSAAISSGEGKVDHPKSLLEIVSFQEQNFVGHLFNHSDGEKYDAVTCFSVTKWIHLNWGDKGLITLFQNIWRLLRPGGILVLEPQPWKSYKSSYLVSKTATLNYHNIVFHPCWFQEILLDKIGFRTVESCISSLPGSATGFNRPVFAFRK